MVQTTDRYIKGDYINFLSQEIYDIPLGPSGPYNLYDFCYRKERQHLLSAYKFWLLLKALESKVKFSELLWDYQNFTNLKNIQITFHKAFLK